MAGIGFELRKLFRKEGLLNNLRAYAYSSMTTVGPMILCMSLILILQYLMSLYEGSYMDWELYIATVSYCFIFSIVFTSGISLLITRYISDCIYVQDYRKLMSSYYGVLSIIVPFSAIVAAIFLSQVQAELSYKVTAYLFFIFLIIIWIQGVYLSALKDYMRIARSFLLGALVAILVAWILMEFVAASTLLSSFIGLDAGFFTICLLTGIHFQQKFPRADKSSYYEFLRYFKKFPLLFFSGCTIYSGIYLHNFVYWFSDKGHVIGDAFHVYMFYDVPVFYAFMSVIPTLIMFVVSVETSFFEKFRHYYLNVLNEGTIQDVQSAKKQMQKTLIREISFLMEIQLLFTVLSIGIGILLLPKIGFTMQQLDLFIILALAYYLFIMLFSLVHILMYFDDKKGVFGIGMLFFTLNIVCTIITMKLEFDGLGMFIASFIALLVTGFRLLYVLRNIDYYTFCAQPVFSKEKVRAKSKKAYKVGTVSMLISICLLMTACSNLTSATLNEQQSADAQGESTTTTELMDDSYPLIDDKRLYERDKDESIKVLYVTVPPQKGKRDELDWYIFNRQADKETAENLEVVVQEGLPGGKGPQPGMYQYEASSINATINLRGNTSWNWPQKSYRIKFFDEAGLYMDQQTINLNKHMGDMSRVRNKLSYDLMETIPDMVSLRTQFIQLYVRDMSSGNTKATYEDYGLYTHVEQPNKKFLRAHLLDPNGYLYKGKFFEFGQYPEVVSTTDDSYDATLFEQFLEIKGRKEHDKLIEVINAVNDYSIPINETVEKYFDLDNILTWTATNILMDNMDTDAHNFFLYSPLNVNKWYYLPWDYDAGWELHRYRDQIRPYQSGISNYWGIILHNRLFRHQNYIDQLTEKVEELYEHYINEDTVKAQLDKYVKNVRPYVERMPDLYYLPEEVEDYDADIERIIATPKRALERYYEDLELPKPFYMSEEVEQSDNKLHFKWNTSYDLQGDQLTYEITIARDTALQDVIVQDLDVVTPNYSIPTLEPGVYYWSVYVRDEKGNRQSNFDQLKDEDGTRHHSILSFEVK